MRDEIQTLCEEIEQLLLKNTRLKAEVERQASVLLDHCVEIERLLSENEALRKALEAKP